MALHLDEDEFPTEYIWKHISETKAEFSTYILDSWETIRLGILFMHSGQNIAKM